jgi:hypothetical protein
VIESSNTQRRRRRECRRRDVAKLQQDVSSLLRQAMWKWGRKNSNKWAIGGLKDLFGPRFITNIGSVIVEGDGQLRISVTIRWVGLIIESSSHTQLDS